MRGSPLALLMLALVAVPALAGCLSGGDDGDGGGDDGSTTTAPYILDCSIGGNGWNESCLALASPNESPSKAEINLAVNPTDPLNVVVASKDKDLTASNDCVWAVAQVSHDGGHTWKTSYVGGQMADRQPGDPYYGWDCITDPIMTFNKDGDLFYNLQMYSLGGARQTIPGVPLLGLGPDGAMMGMAVSHDGGDTWPTFVPEFVGDDLVIFPDYMHMGDNPATGTVFAAWNTLVGLATSNPTMVRYTGSEPVLTPTFFPSLEAPTGYGASSIVGARNGTMYFCICSFNSGGETWWSVSTDDGQTWSTPERKWTWEPTPGSLHNTQFRTGTTVEVAIDNSGGDRDGCLYAAWNGRDMVNNGSDEGDIYVRSSCDGGNTWTDPVLVNNGTQDGAQIMANVAVDGRGGVHVVYLTQHYDLEHDHQFLDAEWAYSTDGGATWTTQRLTQTSFDGDLGVHQDGFPFIGDYIGIDAVGDHIYMAFPDTITGVAEIAVAHVQAQVTTE